MTLPTKCNYGHVFGRLSTNGNYEICCGSTPPSGNYHTDGKFIEYWKSAKLKNLLYDLKHDLSNMNETWADGNCDYCPHFYINEKISDGDIKIPKSPWIYNIDVINICDHRCNFCWNWSHEMISDNAQFDGWNDWIKERIDFKIFTDTIDGLVELGDCEEIQIGGGGEPLLHQDIQEMIKYVKDNNLSCKLITNFCQISEDSLDEMINIGLDYILVNVSAGTQENYCKTRRVKPNTWYKVINNINYIIKNRREKSPKIIMKNIINSENIHEVGEMIDLGVELGVDVVALRFFHEFGVYNSDKKIVTSKQHKKFNKTLNLKIEEYGYKKYYDDDNQFIYNYKSLNTNTLLRGDV